MVLSTYKFGADAQKPNYSVLLKLIINLRAEAERLETL